MPAILATATKAYQPFVASTVHTIRRRRANRTWVPLLLIIAVAAGLRIRGLDRQGRWGDEYFQTIQYDTAPQYIILTARSNLQPPLDFMIGWAVSQFGSQTWLLRVPALCFGIASVLLVFLLARKLFDAPVGLTAAAMLAVSPLHLRLSQEAKPYAILIFFMLLMLILLLRAIERPDWRRVALLLVVEYLMTLTRGLAPLVILLTLGIILAVYSIRPNEPADRRRAVRWVLGTTVLAGLAAVPMLLFLLSGDQQWTVFAGGADAHAQTYSQHLAHALASNLRTWATAPVSFFGAGAYLMMPLAMIGCALVVLRWRMMSVGARIVLLLAGCVGPAYLAVFSATVADTPINHRYALFVAPFLMILASVALVGGLKTVRVLLGGWLGRQALPVAVCLGVFVPSAWSTVTIGNRYFNPDWRGSAEFLAEIAGPDDVVMVFADRPLGAFQPPYWGKYDWPDPKQRPLGESVWTLATSESHWKRLLAQTGSCYLVLKYDVDGQSADQFHTLGLQSAPDGMELTKFRGLDVLSFRSQTDNTDDLVTESIASCDALLDLPLENADARAIAYLLRSRLQFQNGDVDAALYSYNRAVACVPSSRGDWFTEMTRQHATVLADAGRGDSPSGHQQKEQPHADAHGIHADHDGDPQHAGSSRHLAEVLATRGLVDDADAQTERDQQQQMLPTRKHDR